MHKGVSCIRFYLSPRECIVVCRYELLDLLDRCAGAHDGGARRNLRAVLGLQPPRELRGPGGLPGDASTAAHAVQTVTTAGEA